jgi:hypothetical protein
MFWFAPNEVHYQALPTVMTLRHAIDMLLMCSLTQMQPVEHRIAI